jgi:hypothetical protein
MRFDHGFVLASIIAFVEYGASTSSDFDGGHHYYGEMRLILMLRDYIGFTSLKTSHACGLTL